MFGLSAAREWDDEIAQVASVRFETVSPAQQGAGLAEGLVSGTKVATEHGWRAVETVAIGDQVMTFDHGLQKVISIKRAALWHGVGNCPRHLQPMAVPVGALGNEQPLLLLPEQHVVVESDVAESVFGDPFAVIPALALEGYRGITRMAPHAKVEVVQLVFAESQVVYANGMGLIHCASVSTGRIDLMLEEEPFYSVLSLEMARALVAAMISEEYACA